MKRFLWIVALVLVMATGIAGASGVALADDHPVCNVAGDSVDCIVDPGPPACDSNGTDTIPCLVDPGPPDCEFDGIGTNPCDVPTGPPACDLNNGTDTIPCVVDPGPPVCFPNDPTCDQCDD